VTVKQLMVLLGLVFAVVLAIVIGKQMSTEAMAVVVGVVCGVAASIPTSVLLLVAFGRRDRRGQEEMESRSRQREYPPVVVIQGGAPQALPPMQPMGYWPGPQPGPALNRQFHVVGGDDMLVDQSDY
jgi:hypothetical protein